MSEKIEDTYVDDSLGFEVELHDVPLRKFRGEWVLDIEPSVYAALVLSELVVMDEPLTGNHVRFIRHWLDQTQEEFAEPLEVSGAAISKWEDRGGRTTGMRKGTEFQIRMRIARELVARDYTENTLDFRQLYDQVSEFNPGHQPRAIVVDTSYDDPLTAKFGT